MIIFKLSCEANHDFEGWFGDSQDYDQQQTTGLLSCPVCNSKKVNKVLGGTPMLSSPPKPASVPKSDRSSHVPSLGMPPRPTAKRPDMEQAARAIDPVVLIKALDQYVKSNFENVGNKFYDEAIKMHRGEAPARNVYGEVTLEERSKLEEEEIDYIALPKLSPKFEN
jgi:hypothetical protein